MEAFGLHPIAFGTYAPGTGAMVDLIQRLAADSAYDFRVTANPNDPLRYLFPDWIPAYRLKWAIARALRPARILEIGVRFGYSAHAFLAGNPSSEYLGIDIDNDQFGGTKGAIHWARKITQGFQAQFMIADSQRMDRLPGGRYDLVHIDGQQDGQGQLRDLMLALPQSTYALVDGYFWTRSSFLNESEFLFQYRDLIEHYIVIPGYAGDLLIKSAVSGAAGLHVRAASSLHVREHYGERYYLRDCEGGESYRRTQGTRLEEARLIGLAQVVAAAPLGRALDLGCGRGELSVHLAREGYTVSAVDYSDTAVAFTRQTLASASDPELRVDVCCEDVNRAPLTGEYQLVIASDLVEYLSPGEVEQAYARVSRLLAPEGIFFVRTFPSLWLSRYEHTRRRRLARVLGAYLPPDPRSWPERLLRINAQSPRTLRSQLRRHFEHVRVWFAAHESREPWENLRRTFSRSEMRAAGDLYAVASHRRLDPAELLAACSSDAMPADAIPEIAFQVVSAPEFCQGDEFRVGLRLTNHGKRDLRSCPPFPVHLSYHWLDRSANRVLFPDGQRTPLLPQLRAGAARNYSALVFPPAEPGDYTLRFTLVQERVCWFDSPPWRLYGDLPLTCLPR